MTLIKFEAFFGCSAFTLLESFRRGILYVSTNPYAVPSANVTCQKLFYNDHTVVNSLSDIEPNMKLGNYLQKLLSTIFFHLILHFFIKIKRHF